ncbi:SMI1/KNR4 family protein [Kribbella capetownensis]|uniref:SMI1/KNR4 family protein n=1 Tax=Kribbella capetownensis TaxID=1572659 RepID=A0A4R0JZY1_9ACTN|nr:SMI1/KNR4 family protein [Kribbella capetownensis]TCC50948.1 SMI1/KNR4 family protein [Kribbella capetownensis]
MNPDDEATTIEVGHGVSEAVIRAAEGVVGRLPQDYRLFLSRFGHAQVGAVGG